LCVKMRHKRIPGKKRGGYKDLDVRLEKRDKDLAKKKDAAPTDLEQQHIPKKLQMIMKAKDQMGSKPQFKKKKAEVYRGKKLLDSTLTMGTETKLPGMKKPLKPVPVFKQTPGESKKAFYKRMDRTVNAVLQRKKYEDKYDVDVFDNPETGLTDVKDRQKDEINLEVEKKRKTKKGVQIKSKEEKRQIRRAKEKEKRMKKKKGTGGGNDDEGEGEEKEFASNERVAFNDVAHAPPTKLAGFKNSLAERRPGQNANLLLAQKLNPKAAGVSLARQKVLADEREKVIAQYRKIRNEKYAANANNSQKVKRNDGGNQGRRPRAKK